MTVERRIPLSVPTLAGDELAYLRECIESGWVSTAGPFVTRFERAVADYVGARHAVSTSNGTAALHIALLVAGVGPGDEVLVPDLTFIAPVNAVRYCGAEPVFVDVERETWQMDPDAVEAYLEANAERAGQEVRDRRTGRRIGAILPVHLLGLPADLDRLLRVAETWGLPLVQDAAQSVGVRYRGRMVGTLGAVTAFSFNGNKIITSAGGGMVVTDDEAWARRALYLTTQAKDDPLYFRHDTIGFNYRLTNVHAAIGLAQLEQLEGLIAAKRAIHERYRAMLAPRHDLRWVVERPDDRAIYWLVSLTMEGGVERRDRVLRRLLSAGIEARPPWKLNHTQLPYRDAATGPITQAAVIEAEGLHLPSSSSLTEDDQQRVVEELERALDA